MSSNAGLAMAASRLVTFVLSLDVASRVLALERLDLCGQGLDLIKEDRVIEQGPAARDQRLAATHASPPASDSSRLTSTPPIRA